MTYVTPRCRKRAQFAKADRYAFETEDFFATALSEPLPAPEPGIRNVLPIERVTCATYMYLSLEVDASILKLERWDWSAPL